MCELTMSDRTHLSSVDRYDCNRLPIERHELDFVAPAAVNHYDCTDISSLESVCGQINRQNSNISFPNHLYFLQGIRSHKMGKLLAGFDKPDRA